MMSARQKSAVAVPAAFLLVTASSWAATIPKNTSTSGRPPESHHSNREEVPETGHGAVVDTVQAVETRNTATMDDQEAATKLLPTLPEPGKVVESTTYEPLGITSAWLANGVRVHHRFMDKRKGVVYASVTLAGGEIEETAENAGVTQAAVRAINNAATSRLTSAAMRRIMAGKNVRVIAGAKDNAFTIEITASPDDFEIGLQKVHALLTDGKIKESALSSWKRRTLQQFKGYAKTAQFHVVQALDELLSGGDPRRTGIKEEKIEAQSVEKAQAWFDRLCRQAPIEVAVVGDIKLKKAMPLIERYLGSLPKRSRTAEHLDKLRCVEHPKGPLTKHVEFETTSLQGMVIAGFLGCEGRNVSDSRALQLASMILDRRVPKRLRDQRSLTTSIRISSGPSWVYEDTGRFTAHARCTPADADKLADEIHKMFQEFADSGPTKKELATAKKETANFYATAAATEPTYWWRLLQFHDLHGRSLEEEQAAKEAFQRLTAEEIQTVFKKYYTPSRQFRVIAVPKKPAASERKEPKG